MPDEHAAGEGRESGAGRPRRAYPGPLAFAGIGILNALCLLGGLALGWLADSAAGTLPLFLMTGLVCGAVLGVAVTRSELRRYGR
jgi:hypothetical protein